MKGVEGERLVEKREVLTRQRRGEGGGGRRWEARRRGHYSYVMCSVTDLYILFFHDMIFIFS